MAFRHSSSRQAAGAVFAVFVTSALLLLIASSSLPCLAEEGADAAAAAASETGAASDGGENVAEMLGLERSVLEERMKVVLEKIDADGDGRVTEAEFRVWLIKIRTAVQQKQVSVEVKAIDKDKDGLITIQELKAAYGASGEPSDDQMKEVETRFKIVDKNGDGSLDKTELALLMEPSGDPELLRLETEEILTAQDKDKDGKITITEFAEGEAAGEDQQELEREFKLYDSNGDGVIDREEIEKVIADPHQHEVEGALKDLQAHFRDGAMDAETWTSELDKLAISSATDNGELLRLPEDYPGLDLPFSNVEKEAEEEREEL